MIDMMQWTSAPARMQGPKAASVPMSRLRSSPRIVVPHSSLFLQLSRENTDLRCFDLLVLYADMPEQHQLAIHIQLLEQVHRCEQQSI
jgi:hypothetical protein